MPWFCPSCKKIMKKKLDNKMWNLFNHCFECQIEKEHEMRTRGVFKQWEAKKVLVNKRSIIENISPGISEVSPPVKIKLFFQLKSYQVGRMWRSSSN